MQVLYKELKSFAHLASYLERNSLEVVYANVAISWAILDHGLDDFMDISNKTTTNITAEDFCRSVDLGQYFGDNVLSFHQQEAIESMKKDISKYRKVYDSFTDVASRERYFALLLFFLCPYRQDLFQGLLGAEVIERDFSQDEMRDLISNQIEIGRKKPTLCLSLVYRFLYVLELPMLLLEINPEQAFYLELFQIGTQYRVVFRAVPVGCGDRSDQEDVVSVTEDVVSVSEDVVTVAEDVVSVTEDVVTAEVEEAQETECPVPSYPVTLQQHQPNQEEQDALEALLEGIDLPAPVTAQPCHGQGQKEVAEIFARIAPALPSVEMMSMPRDFFQKSCDMLDTMEEIVGYIKAQYPLEDPLYQELLESMGLGIESLQNLWKEKK